MGIELKYGNPAGVLGAAYAAGRNRAAEKRRREGQRLFEQQQAMQYDAARRMQQQEFMRERDADAFGQRALLQESAFQHSDAQQQAYLDSYEKRQQAGFARADAAAGVAFERQKELDQGRMSGMEDLQIGRQIGKGELTLSPAQQKELQEVDANIAAIPNGPIASDEQKREAMEKYQARRSAVLRQAQPRPEQEEIPIQDSLGKDMFWASGTPGVGRGIGKDSKGKYYAIDPPAEKEDNGKKVAFDQSLKLQTAKTNYRLKLQNMSKEVGEKQVAVYTPEQIDEMVEKEFGPLEKSVGFEQQQAGAEAAGKFAGAGVAMAGVGVGGRDTIAPQGEALRLPGPAQPAAGGGVERDLVYRVGRDDQGTGPAISGEGPVPLNRPSTGPAIREMGQGVANNPNVQRAIQDARAGNANAQRALEERGIRWQQ
jgi:hypothetical protein